MHGRNVSLILDRNTGLVSPQFHVSFYPTFDSVKDIKTPSMWQVRAGFVTQRETKNQEETPQQMTIDRTPTERSRKRKRKEVSRKEAVTPESQETGNQAASGGDASPPRPRNANEGATKGIDQQVVQTTTRSGRKAKPPPRLIEAMAIEIAETTSHHIEGELFCYATMFPNDDRADYDDPLLAYKATSDPDTLYYHQAKREDDKEQFLESMEKEIRDQFENGNFTIVHRSEVPKGDTVLPAVWQIRRKRDVKSAGKIKKYKARLNVD